MQYFILSTNLLQNSIILENNLFSYEIVVFPLSIVFKVCLSIQKIQMIPKSQMILILNWFLITFQLYVFMCLLFKKIDAK